MCETGSSCAVPFGGNAFITGEAFPPNVSGVITPSGLSNWVSDFTIISLYFYMQYPGLLLAALRLRVPHGSSRISFSLTHNYKNAEEQVVEGKDIHISGSEFQLVKCGIFTIPVAGYVRLDLKGLERTGPTFGLVSHAVFVSESSPLLKPKILRFVDDPLDHHFGRRGASVHMNYVLPASPEIQYFYNEIYVPKNQDVIGAYYCAIGFNGGYFGIQVNSIEERRVLFSIWSDFDTNNANEVPEDYKVKLIRSEEDVRIGEFGNEGSGAQAIWRHMWKSEMTYKFLVQAKPIDPERTMYTAWFSSGDPYSSWKLIASFEKPKVSTFLRRSYSFSENFIPEMGHVERHCIFFNQWAYDMDGNWSEVREARFTTDDAGNRQIRLDFAGGVGIDGDKKRFFLKNCGFFSEWVEPRSLFTRESSGEGPSVDLSMLP